jgi:integrase
MAEELRAYNASNLAGNISVPAALLEFIILTATRTQEPRLMEWSEIYWDEKMWLCPWQRIKPRLRDRIEVDQQVPLSPPAIANLQRLRAKHDELGVEAIQRKLGLPPRVFVHMPTKIKWLAELRQRAGAKQLAGKVYDDHSVRTFLHDSLGRQDLSVHGFRTAFSSWAQNRGYKHVTIEMALTHVVGNVVARIYTRDDDQLIERRTLLEDWANYCGQAEPQAANVTRLKRKSTNV